MFDAVLVINQYVMIINLASLLKSYLGQYAVHKFTLIWSKKVILFFFIKNILTKNLLGLKKMIKILSAMQNVGFVIMLLLKMILK